MELILRIRFCPAHITGFFKYMINQDERILENLGSTGAGFSIKQGVTTSVKINIKNNDKENFQIITKGYKPDKTNISEYVIKEFLKLGEIFKLIF